jgi:hypothetical protein
MFAHPASYLNGTAPSFNVTGTVNTCVFQLGDSDESVCTLVNGTDRDSYLWWVPLRHHGVIETRAEDSGMRRFNELHPSEQADRVVAGEIANIIETKGSRWVDWLS